MNIEFKPIHNYTINLGGCTGEFKLYWDFNPEEGPSVRPVRVTLTWGNVTLDTGFRGSPEYNTVLNDLGYANVSGQSSNGFLTLVKNQETPTTATVTLYTPIEESLAKLELICPAECSPPDPQPGFDVFM